MRNAAKIVAKSMTKMVNYVIHCDTNHHVNDVMTMTFYILGYVFWSTSIVRKVKNFNLSLLLCYANTEHFKNCLNFFFNFSSIQCFESHSIQQVLYIESVSFFVFSLDL